MVALKRAEADCLATRRAQRLRRAPRRLRARRHGARISKPLFGALRPAWPRSRARIAAAARPAPVLRRPLPARPPARAGAPARRASSATTGRRAGSTSRCIRPRTGAGGDVRITTRIDEADPRECVYSPPCTRSATRSTRRGSTRRRRCCRAGAHASMGVHESQSRLFENQLGRSRAFCDWLYPAMREASGDIGLDGRRGALPRGQSRSRPASSAPTPTRCTTTSTSCCASTSSARWSGATSPSATSRRAWNDRFLADFGRAVPDAGAGCCRTCHWSVGLFGYFPTYTLGNVYAAELDAALRRDLPDLDARLAAGDLAPGASTGSAPASIAAAACSRRAA